MNSAQRRKRETAVLAALNDGPEDTVRLADSLQMSTGDVHVTVNNLVKQKKVDFDYVPGGPERGFKRMVVVRLV